MSARQAVDGALARVPGFGSEATRGNIAGVLAGAPPAAREALGRALLNGSNPGIAGPLETPEERPEPFPLLRDLLERPELLEPPAEVLPRLAWRGRASLLAAPDKAGKSTVAAHGVAALSRGRPWLGERLQAGRVVVVAPDEATGDTVRRLVELDAHPDRVRILGAPQPDLLLALDGLLQEEGADLVVVDSLAEYARLTAGGAPEDGDSAGWGRVVRPLVAMARARDVGLLVLHHVRRSDGQYRGSGEIAAAFDALLEMLPPQSGEDPTLRRFRGRARWPVEDWSVRMDGDRYVLGAGGPLPLEARVLADLATHPGATRADQYRRLLGRKAAHSAAVNLLVEGGQVVDRAGRLFLPGDVEDDLL